MSEKIRPIFKLEDLPDGQLFSLLPYSVKNAHLYLKIDHQTVLEDTTYISAFDYTDEVLIAFKLDRPVVARYDKMISISEVQPEGVEKVHFHNLDNGTMFMTGGRRYVLCDYKTGECFRYAIKEGRVSYAYLHKLKGSEKIVWPVCASIEDLEIEAGSILDDILNGKASEDYEKYGYEGWQNRLYPKHDELKDMANKLSKSWAGDKEKEEKRAETEKKANEGLWDIKQILRDVKSLDEERQKRIEDAAEMTKDVPYDAVTKPVLETVEELEGCKDGKTGVKKPDMINKPPHYISKSGLETIDVIEAFTENLTGIEAFCAGNVLKYVCRWSQKNGLEDLEKASWYLEKLKISKMAKNEVIFSEN